MAFKMKGMSFGNSPMKQDKKTTSDSTTPTDKKRLNELKKLIKDDVGPDGFDLSTELRNKYIAEMKTIFDRSKK